MALTINTINSLNQLVLGGGGGEEGKYTNMGFVETSHDTQKCHKCRFLECKESWLELVFGGNFCQLHLDVFTKC